MANTKGSDNPFPSLLIVEGTEPTAPSAGLQRLYIDSTTHKLKRTDSAGADVDIEASSGLSDPMTTRGDIIVRNASNVTARLGRGSASQVLTSNGTDLAWASPSGGSALASGTATVATAQTTTSNTFVDLTTTGPAVTVTVNTKVMVIVSCEFSSASASQYGAMGFAASSGNTVAAARTKAYIGCTADDGTSSTVFAGSRTIMLTGLTPGSTVFTAKYSSLTGGTVSFSNRDITVVCLD
jgi:hypothetical protein